MFCLFRNASIAPLNFPLNFFSMLILVYLGVIVLIRLRYTSSAWLNECLLTFSYGRSGLSWSMPGTSLRCRISGHTWIAHCHLERTGILLPGRLDTGPGGCGQRCPDWMTCIRNHLNGMLRNGAGRRRRNGELHRRRNRRGRRSVVQGGRRDGSLTDGWSISILNGSSVTGDARRKPCRRDAGYRSPEIGIMNAVRTDQICPEGRSESFLKYFYWYFIGETLF